MLLFVISFCLILGWAACGVVALESDMKKLTAIIDRIRNTIKDHPIVFVGVIGLAVAIRGHYLTYGRIDVGAFEKDFYGNYFAEIMGIVVTVYLIDRLNQQRDEKRETSLEKERLMVQARSGDVHEAAQAIRILGNRGWLSETNLVGINLSGADLSSVNLSGANLFSANLSGANLRDANLSGTRLVYAQLGDAILIGANLSGADLYYANVSKAELFGANLTGAKLFDANLSGANLFSANLSGSEVGNTNLTDAIYNKDTKWPQRPDGFDPIAAGAVRIVETYY